MLVIQHAESVPLALFGHWLAEAGMCVDIFRGYAEPIPPLSSLDTSYSGLLVLGGAMDVDSDEEHPWLPTARERIVQAAEAGIPTLGICLGHQLAAVALGGTVERSPFGLAVGVRQVTWEPEVLFDPLMRLLAGDDRAMHWHRDVVGELPEGAVKLASSIDGQVQAARFAPTVWGVQFHPEVDAAVVKGWAETSVEELEEIGRTVDDVTASATFAENELIKTWQPLAFGFARLVRERAAAVAPGASRDGSIPTPRPWSA
ncbi:GMP synthase-like glutamine amidotransferase [Nocardioides luteus]|uniref:type 1 glutamine amidotransferase n=1 Tax=Nocardioides luteus TaxID=1844 RepID=UPI00166B0B76|nr:type 1 glutamine amidotransferase [Nocardioides luteus]MDR7311259.1 GMP synthase-like glutamine amidotransferase [Nocardioides luteus]